jgi:DNA polymerase III subunit delta
MTAPKARQAVTLLWGEDAFLLREEALRVLGDLRATEVEASQWEGGELQDLATPSLFGERRALLVSNARALTKDAIAELAIYLRAPDPDAPLVLSAQVGERAKAPASLEKLVKPVGAVRRVAMARKDLEPWLVQRAQGRGTDLAAPGARALAETVGADPGQLAAALDQLADAFAGQRITPALVAQQFRGLGDQRVWDLCDRAFTLDLPGAMRSLRSIEEGGDDALKTLGGIAARLRDLIKVRSLPDRTSPEEVARTVGLRFDWQARRYQQQARRFTPEQLVAMHTRITEADRALKSGAAGDVVMPTLVAAIAARQ